MDSLSSPSVGLGIDDCSVSVWVVYMCLCGMCVYAFVYVCLHRATRWWGGPCEETQLTGAALLFVDLVALLLDRQGPKVEVLCSMHHICTLTSLDAYHI